MFSRCLFSTSFFLSKIVTGIRLGIIGLFFCNITFGQVKFEKIIPSGISGAGTLLGILDYDNDGLEDLLVRESDKVLSIYRNEKSGFSKKDIGYRQFLGDASIINKADFDNDGYYDVVIFYSDSIALLKNIKNGNFKNVTKELGFQFSVNGRKIQMGSTQDFSNLYTFSQWIDYDADKDLDLVVLSRDLTNSYLEVIYNDQSIFNRRKIILTFPNPIQPRFLMFDYDNDIDLDILILNFSNPGPPFSQYNYQPLKLFENNGLDFTDKTVGSGLTLGSNHGFVKLFDYNNDGFTDIIFGTTDNVFNSSPLNRVYKNNGNKSFTDVSKKLNLFSGFGYYRFVFPNDFNNDGFTDVLYSSNTFLYMNLGNETFSANVYRNSSLPDLLDIAAIFDYNADGWLDIITNKLEFYKNVTGTLQESQGNNYLNVHLGRCKALTDPRGAKVFLYTKNLIQSSCYTNGDIQYYNSIYSNYMHFGIGKNTQIDSLVVVWEDGVRSKYNPKINSTVFLTPSTISDKACADFINGPPLSPGSNDLFCPNTFTPNGDGKNDVLKVYGTYQQSTLSVYNQWGKLLFTGDGSIGWDGRHKGVMQPNGTYVYVAEVEVSGQRTVTKKGNVNLIR
jgi:gliding motility-associated-like protein